MRGLLIKSGILKNNEPIDQTASSDGRFYFPSTAFGQLFTEGGSSSLSRARLAKLFGRTIYGGYPEYYTEEAVQLAARLCLASFDRTSSSRIEIEKSLLETFDAYGLISISSSEKKEPPKEGETRNVTIAKYLIRQDSCLYVQASGSIGIRFPLSHKYSSISTSSLISLSCSPIGGLCGGATVSTSIHQREYLTDIMKSVTLLISKEIGIANLTLQEVVDTVLALSIRKIITSHGGGTFIFHDAKATEEEGLFDPFDEKTKIGSRTISLLLSMCSDNLIETFVCSRDLREKNPKTNNYIDLFVLKRSLYLKKFGFLGSLSPVKNTGLLDKSYIVKFENKEDGSIVEIEA